jgi:6-phosphogluconolactonase (cycloisomerase 2 family)
LHYLPNLDDPHVLNLPLIDTGSGEAIISHPHQVMQHPGKGDTFFVTDLGQDVVHTLTIKEGRLVYHDAWKAEGSELHGIRHGVFDDTSEPLLTFEGIPECKAEYRPQHLFHLSKFGRHPPRPF